MARDKEEEIQNFANVKEKLEEEFNNITNEIKEKNAQLEQQKELVNSLDYYTIMLYCIQNP